METTAVAREAVTLRVLMEQEPLTAPKALQYAVQLASAVRTMHEKGEVCGSLDPAQIRVVGEQMEVQPASAHGPYTAPELLAGANPDVRSDIFALGAVVYRMLCGRLPFPGNSPEEIERSIREDAPAPMGALKDGDGYADAEQFPALERVIFQCLEKKPERRWPRVKTLCTELKLLNTFAGRLQPMPDAGASLQQRMREQIAELEAKVEVRLEACERSVAGLEGALAAFDQLRSTLDRLQERLHSQEQSIEALNHTATRTDDLLERVVESIAGSNAALAGIEQRCSGAQSQLEQFIPEVESRFAAQAESVEACRTSCARTDDLLDRVVESIGSLQNFVLERLAASGVRP